MLRSRQPGKRHNSRGLRRTARILALETLENRRLLVTGPFDEAAIAPDDGFFDGVVHLNTTSANQPSCTGALLDTGRHIMTAAHCVSNPATQTITLVGVLGGSFTLSLDGDASDAIVVPFLNTQDISAEIEDALEDGIAAIDNVTVAQDPNNANSYTIKFHADLAFTDVSTLAADSSNLFGVNPNVAVADDAGGSVFAVPVRFQLTTPGTNTSEDFVFFAGTDTSAPVIHPDWDFELANGQDVAVLPLNAIAPWHAQRYFVDHGLSDDMTIDELAQHYVGEQFYHVGFGNSGTGEEGQVPNTAGQRRWGENEFDSHNAQRLQLQGDFDSGADEHNQMGGLGLGDDEVGVTAGDSGGPQILQSTGAIAGVAALVTGGAFGQFGTINSFSMLAMYTEGRDSNYDIDDIIYAPAPVTLDMNFQPERNDGSSDTIEARTAGIGGNTLELLINGSVIWSDAVSRVMSLTIFGSDDDETIIVSALGDDIPVQVAGRGGDDVIRLDGLSDAFATLVGDGGADTIVIGDGDIPSNIEGPVWVFGGGNLSNAPDTLVLDDRESGEDYNYRLDGNTFTMSSYPEIISHSAVEEVHLLANEGDNTIRIPSTAFNTSVSVSANSGDDIFRFGGGDIDTNIAGDVQVHGGFGDDVLVLLDADDAAGGDTHSLDATTYTKTDYDGTLTFHFIQEVRLLTGATQDTVDVLGTSEDVTRLLIDTDGGADTVSLHATHANTTADIRTRRGNDLVELAPDGGDLGAIRGYVVVDAGNGSSDELVLNDEDGEAAGFYTVHANVVTRSSGPQIDHSGVESLTLRATPFDDHFFIESLFSTTDVGIEAGDGRDTLRVAPASRQLLFVQGSVFFDGGGGPDAAVLHDEENPVVDAPLTIQDDLVTRPGFALHYEDASELVVLLGGPNDFVDIQSTAPGMHVMVNTAGGNDTVLADVPPHARLTLDGNTGADSVTLTGTPADDGLSVSAGFGTADVNLVRFEDAHLDLAGGTDTLFLVGIAAQDEDVELHASTTAAQGLLRVGGLFPVDLAFENTEIIDLLANPGDADRAIFLATDQDDELAIHLAAAGTAVDPVLQLYDPLSLALLLTLRDYANFGSLNVLGDDGTDLFNVHVAPAGPGTGRNLSIDGGLPAGGGDGKDELNVYYETPPKPDIDHDHDNQADSGTFEIEYSLEEFVIEYFNVEKAVAKSAAAG